MKISIGTKFDEQRIALSRGIRQGKIDAQYIDIPGAKMDCIFCRKSAQDKAYALVEHESRGGKIIEARYFSHPSCFLAAEIGEFDCGEENLPISGRSFPVDENVGALVSNISLNRFKAVRFKFIPDGLGKACSLCDINISGDAVYLSRQLVYADVSFPEVHYTHWQCYSWAKDGEFESNFSYR